MKKLLAIILGGVVLWMLVPEKSEEPVPPPLMPQAQVPLGNPNPESLFAEIDPDTKEVLRVIVITPEELQKGNHGDPSRFVETFINGGTRKNYAGKGMIYDETINAFVIPKTTSTDVFNPATAKWETPQVIKTLEELSVASSTYE